MRSYLYVLFLIFSFALMEVEALQINDLQLERPDAPINDKLRIKIASYLMPENHPIKPALDQLFSASRVLLNWESLCAAGFEATKPRKFTRLIVASHPDFPGYIFKLFVDAQRYEKKELVHEYWINRIVGARLIEEQIVRNGWQHYFKVPKKMLYILPKDPQPPKEFYAKNSILVEDNMNIFSSSDNNALWKSDSISTEFLKALFTLAESIGLGDMKPDNIPFSLDGRAAFVDTQTYHVKGGAKKMTSYLSPENQTYWKQLIKNSS